MTTTETILNYAAMHGGAFRRKELLRDLAGEQTDSKGRMLDLQLSRLVASGKLDVSLLASHIYDGWEYIPEALQIMKDKPAELIKPVVRLA